MSEHDEIGHANREISQLLRMGLQIASRFAEQMARAREQQIRNAQAQSEQAARELRARLSAERSAAEAGLRPVMTDRWWNEAGPEQIADNWQTARAWQDHSEVAAQAADRIRQEVQSRYGIDVDNPGVDPQQIDQLLRDAEASKNAGNNEQDLADRDRRMASDLMAEAERLDRDRDLLGTDIDDSSTTDTSTTSDDLRAQAEVEYDSADRRDALASDMRDAGVDKEAVGARMCADLDQGKHPRGAVQNAPRNAPQARKGKSGPSQSKQLEHSGR